MGAGLGVSPERVIELFAGVGGIRFGLENANLALGVTAFETVWANQFEPSIGKQHAAKVYAERWGDTGFSNRDINLVIKDPAEMAEIAALNPTMLVGGFPCQDYSILKPLNQSAGLEGKKGVLWWAIYKLLASLLDKGQPIQCVLLENVDRLLASPKECPGRDFAVMLSSLQSLGYGVEWRVVNAADYGYPQKRKRTFILAYHRSTNLFKRLAADVAGSQGAAWLGKSGVLADALPVQLDEKDITGFPLSSNVLECQESYVTDSNGKTRFASAGVCINNLVCTARVIPADIPDYTQYVGQVEPMTLGDVVKKTNDVPEEFFIDESDIDRWREKKGGKSKIRTTADGFEYEYREGAMQFPDALDRPSRTIITDEGGVTASRTKHAVLDKSGRYRRLIPEELEVLNGFPRGFTKVDGVSDSKRAFLIGNALVTGLVTAIAQSLHRHSH